MIEIDSIQLFAMVPCNSKVTKNDNSTKDPLTKQVGGESVYSGPDRSRRTGPSSRPNFAPAPEGDQLWILQQKLRV